MKVLVAVTLTLFLATPAAAACLNAPCDYTGDWQPGDPFDSSYLPEVPYDPASEPRYDDVAETWSFPDGTVIYVGNAGSAGLVLASNDEAGPVSRPDGALMPEGVLRFRRLVGVSQH